MSRIRLTRLTLVLLALTVSPIGLVAQDGGTIVQPLHVDDTGAGPPIVLVHGGVMDLRMWDPQAEALSDEFRIIRFDVRGFGRSPAPGAPFSPADDLANLLDRLGVGRAHVIGLSMGGGIALDFALSHPDRVSSLVLAEPGLAGWAFSAEVMESMSRVIQAMRSNDRDATLEAIMDGPAFRYAKTHNPDAYSTIRSLAEQNLMGFRVLAMMRMNVEDPTTALGRIDVPVLSLKSEGAGEDAIAIAELLAREIVDIETVVIEGAGHMMNLEQPERFNAAVRAFIQQNES